MCFSCLTELEYITLITLLPAYSDSAISLGRYSCSQISTFHEKLLQVDLGVTLAIPKVTLVDHRSWIDHLNCST